MAFEMDCERQSSRADVTAGHQARTYSPIIDALSAHVALIDCRGTILEVNKAWKRYSDANGNCDPRYGIGSNYLDLLDGIRCCAGDGETELEEVSMAHKVAAGLRQVLSGELNKFQIEYPCNSPTERHWFLLTITPFPGAEQIKAVIAHEDLTPLMRANEELLRQSAQLACSFSNTVEAIALAVEKRDAYTAGHQQQVVKICHAIGRVLDLDEHRLRGLLLGAQIHDIGKIAVPIDILGKPTKLTRPEMEIMRAHPENGFEILKGIDFPWPIAEMVYQHHERLDGSGYPRGLSGDEICLEARIIAVADVFDAITSHRPYRPAKRYEDGIAELTAGCGRIYDAAVVDAFLAHLRNNLEQATDYCAH